jgi:hypothetical protein
MKDPERLAEADASALARRMLSAAREEAPSDAAFERTIAALGVGAVVLGAGATATVAATGVAGVAGGGALTGAAKVVPSGLLFGATKWLGIGAVSGLVTAGVAGSVATLNAPAQDAARGLAAARTTSEARPAAPRAPRASARASELTPPETSEIEATEASEVSEVSEAAKALPRVARSSRAVAQDPAEVSARQARLAAEVEAVDRAREAVARGDSARALAALEAYERGFAEQRLRPEALYLRMEALLRRGDAAGARSAARAVLAADPQGPHAARAREVLSVAP